MAKENELLIPLEENEKHEKGTPYISLSTSYVKGRGYFLHVTPMHVGESNNGIAFRSFMLFSGARQLIESANRLNRKKEALLFNEAVEDYKAKRGPAYALILHVLEKENLKLKEEPATVPV